MVLAVLEAVGLTGALLQVLFDRLIPSSESFLDHFRAKGLNHELLEELQIELLAASAVLDDAEEKRDTNRVVRRWLDGLQSAAYDAEDLLNDISMALRPQNEEGASSQELPRPLVNSFNARLTSILKKLEHLVRQKDRIGLKERGLGADRPSSMLKIPTTSLIDQSEIYGRGKEKEELLSLLLSDEEVHGNEVPVIAITGMPAVGKTTLAQLLYNDEKVKHHFGIRTWAHVGEEFDIVGITRVIYESILNRSSDLGAGNLDLLQVKLKEILIGRKFLIVLDDVWNEDFIAWDLLQKPLRAGSKGSKIIVTAQSRNVSLTMRAFHGHNLLPLSDPHDWFLFASHAFGVKSNRHDKVLERVGRKIVRKCCGLPLALKLLGSALRSKDNAEEWLYVSDSVFWDLLGNNILPALKSSYSRLSGPLKTCFAYCSLFPEDYKFNKEEIVRLWMAQGLFHRPMFKWRIEEVVNEQFNALVAKSFLQESAREGVYSMHHLINDFARHVGGEFYCCFSEARSGINFNRVRYLSYLQERINPCDLMSFVSAALRAFIALEGKKSSKRDMRSAEFYHFLLSQPNLRVLSVSGLHGITIVPDSVGRLKHLRYLDLSGKDIVSLPETVCFLYELQTLLLKNCKFLKSLPRGTYKLINLRNLDLTGAPIQSMPPHFSNLTSLQSLSTFVVSLHGGSKIIELKKLSELRGKLAIVGLHNVTDALDASEANLKIKQHLSELELCWDNGGKNLNSTSAADGFNDLNELNGRDMPKDSEVQSCVLDQLQPHKNLQKLTIRSYSGVSFPAWLADYYSLSNMVALRISDCRQCTSLPPLGQLSSLKELVITNMEHIEELGPELYGTAEQPFFALEVLQFTNMPKWMIWSEARGAFPSLKNLHIEKCPELRGVLPMHLKSLESVKIHFCEKLDLNYSTLKEVVAIKELDIRSSCYSLESFPMGSYSILERLTINCCSSLRSLYISNELQMVSLNLRELKITNCSKLEGFQGDFDAPSLTWLSISNCPNFMALPVRMHDSFRSLESLSVTRCPSLLGFPDDGLPRSLQNLTIEDCDILTPNREWRLSDMKALESLEIKGGCSDLESFPEEGLLPVSLSQLHISDLPSLRSLNDMGLKALTHLKTLSITGCSSMECISKERLPNSISSLLVADCPCLYTRCKVGGPDWYKISRIPSIHIPDDE